MTPNALLQKARNAKHVLIGASAGGVDALRTVLPRRILVLPLTVVMHVAAKEKSLLPSVLGAHVPYPVAEPEDKELPLPGRLYVAPPNYHLLLEEDGAYALSEDDPVNFSRPSIDLAFESAADAFKHGLLAILLTGANQDGAEGVRRVLDQGGHAIVQAPETAYAPEMPRAAIQRSPDVTVLTLPEIRSLLESLGPQ